MSENRTRNFDGVSPPFPVNWKLTMIYRDIQ